MENRYRTLETKIEEWAEDKGILSKATPTTQALKTLEECNELYLWCKLLGIELLKL